MPSTATWCGSGPNWRRPEMRERWYLFGNDADLALQLLRKDIEQAESNAERAALVRFLPNLGRHEEAATWLTQRQPELLKELHGRVAWMRVLQHRGAANPWLAMLPQEQAAAFHHYSQEVLHGRAPLDLWLGGGLGDQLECLARLHSGLAGHPLHQRLRLVFPEANRPAMERLLTSFWPAPASPWCFSSGQPHSLEQRPWISLLPFYAVLSGAGLFSPPAVVANGFYPADDQLPSLVCCWRSKVDPEEKLWAHLRSLPFSTLLRVYAELVPEARRAGLHLCDITRYSAAEARALERFAPTLELCAPRLTSLADTARLILSSRAVISVDTALVHLAGWFDWPTLLLLHQHPDERWQPLLKQPDQQTRVRILQQGQYNHWADPAARLTGQLQQWLKVMT
jgi:hypothetical protein